MFCHKGKGAEEQDYNVDCGSCCKGGSSGNKTKGNKVYELKENKYKVVGKPAQNNYKRKTEYP